MNKIALLVLGCAVAAAIVADQIRPPEPPAVATVSTSADSGLLACPMVRWGGGSGRIVLAARDTAAIRLTFVPAKGKAVDLVSRIPAGMTRSVGVPSSLKGNVSAIVRYTGGPVAAAHTLALARSDEGGGGQAGAACLRPEGASVAVTHLSTLRATSRLSVFNPGNVAATISITVNADGRVLTPTNYLGVDVPSRSRREFNLGDFAFDAARLTAVVTSSSSSGRVVVEGLVRSRAGVSLISAAPARRSVVTASGRSGAGTSFAVGLVGDEDAGLDATFISTTEQGRAGGLPASLEPAGTARIGIPERNDGGPVAYGIDLTVGSPVVSGAGWRRERAGRLEQAIAEGVAPARRWIAVAPSGAAVTRALLVNGARSSTVTLLRLGGTSEEIEVAAGRVVVVTLKPAQGFQPAIDISASAPIGVFLDVTGANAAGGWTYGYAGTPDRTGEPVAVEVDPRNGVPATRIGETRVTEDQ